MTLRIATTVVFAGVCALSCAAQTVCAADADRYAAARTALVAEIEAGVRATADHLGRERLAEPVLEALRRVPRHAFVAPYLRPLAYHNRPLPIGHGQTISQPYIVAIMTDLLEPRPGDRVLELGTGSGYQAAVLAEIVEHVYTIETVEPLAASARERLADLGYANVSVRHGDGYFGWPEHAPFDAIVVTAAASHVPPPQLALFTDGDGMTVITDGNRPAADYTYLDQLTSALPYHLGVPRAVLVLGAGGGSEVLQAHLHGADDIVAVELNPQLAELVTSRYGDFGGRLFERPGITLRIAEARGFIATDTARYDVVTLAFLDTRGVAAAGLRSLQEDYLYTLESFAQLLDRLAPDGWLALTRWIDLPPRDLLKLAATAAVALERRGVDDPGAHILFVRGWQTGTLLVKNGVVTPDDVARARRFAAARSFDLDWAPGVDAAATNRYNRLARSYFHEALRALLGSGREAFSVRYKFDLRPATDDRPYFSHFARPGTLPELLALRGRGGMPLIEWGYLVPIATLLQALLASAALILLPVWRLRRAARHRDRGRTWRVAAYFGAIGLAFLFIEIACIQRFTLLLHHPVYASATVLSGFLVFAGLGSACAARLARADRHAVGVRSAVAAIAAVTLLHLAVLDGVFDALMPWPLWARMLAGLLLVMPLAFAMGLPFPLGLTRIAPELLPWAWGVNGCASVIGAVLAALIALHWGFSAVLLAAVALYLLAAAWLPDHRSARPDLRPPAVPG